MTPRPASDADAFAPIAPHYDALMSNVPYHQWAHYITQLVALAGRSILPGSKLLDLATGTGPIALQFAARRCDVTGIDCSEPMLLQARRKTAQRGLDVHFLCRDLRDFQLPPEFDLAVCLYDSLNYILDADALEQAFVNTRAALKPDGLFIFDINTVHALEAELFTQKNAPGAAVEYRWKSKYDPKTRTSRIHMRFHVLSTGEKITLIHHQRAYTDTEIRSLLRDAGFGSATAYEAYQTTPPDPRSDRVFYVASARP